MHIHTTDVFLFVCHVCMYTYTCNQALDPKKCSTMCDEAAHTIAEKMEVLLLVSKWSNGFFFCIIIFCVLSVLTNMCVCVCVCVDFARQTSELQLLEGGFPDLHAGHQN